MKLTKDVVHLIDFSAAPAEVKAAAKNLKDSMKRLHKAETQFANWRVERLAASKENEECFNELQRLSEAWSPDTGLEERVK